MKTMLLAILAVLIAAPSVHADAGDRHGRDDRRERRDDRRDDRRDRRDDRRHDRDRYDRPPHHGGGHGGGHHRPPPPRPRPPVYNPPPVYYPPPAYPGYPYANIIRCESDGYRTNVCYTGRRPVQLYRQLSSAPCIYGRTFSINFDNVAVWGGCRAEFIVR